MKNVAKVILSTIIGLVLWAVFGVLFLLIVGVLLGTIEPLARIVGWIYASDLWGHLVPTLLYAIPCIMPAWVISKIHAGNFQVRRIALWTMCAIVVLLITTYAVISEDVNWWAVIQGLIGTAMAFGIFASKD